MPGWSRRLRIMIDWAFALLFRPDVVKIDLASEPAWLLRVSAAGAASDGAGSSAVPAPPPAEGAGQPPGSQPLVGDRV
jgi:hypothetical protein